MTRQDSEEAAGQRLRVLNIIKWASLADVPLGLVLAVLAGPVFGFPVLIWVGFLLAVTGILGYAWIRALIRRVEEESSPGRRSSVQRRER